MRTPDKNVVYMEVTLDKYELPIVIADSAKELAEILGTTPNAIKSSISHHKERGTRCRYVKVELEEDE